MLDESEDLGADGDVADDTPRNRFYKVRFRSEGQEFTAKTTLGSLKIGSAVFVETDHGPEPALVAARAAGEINPGVERQASYTIVREATKEEEQQYDELPMQEKTAYRFCKEQVEKLGLPMALVRVERFFDGSKIIFYFTADNRVDFRELVKTLVQEFRTRVEMRQIGVRHETQMIGGLGYCGRELCCSSYLVKFDSVSIKMAKTQDLPLNPAKISGCCNRLLCCLTYEYKMYRDAKKKMPRPGRNIVLEDGEELKIIRQLPLTGEVVGINSDGEEHTLTEQQWRSAQPVQKSPGKRGQGKRGQGKKERPARNESKETKK